MKKSQFALLVAIVFLGPTLATLAGPDYDEGPVIDFRAKCDSTDHHHPQKLSVSFAVENDAEQWVRAHNDETGHDAYVKEETKQ